MGRPEICFKFVDRKRPGRWKGLRLCCLRFIIAKTLKQVMVSHEVSQGSRHDPRVISALRLCTVDLMAHQSPIVVNRGLDAKGQSVHSFGLKKRSLFKPFPGPTLVDVERDPQGFFFVESPALRLHDDRLYIKKSFMSFYTRSLSILQPCSMSGRSYRKSSSCWKCPSQHTCT